MSVYPPPRDVGPIFNPEAYLKVEFEQYLPLAGGILSGSVNQRLGNFTLTGTGQNFNVLGGGSYRASNQVVLTQTALGASVATSNLQSVGTLNTLSVAGNVSVGSTLVASSLQAASGIPDSQVLAQGAYQAWNSAGGSGSVDFINKFGLGGERAFNFFTSDGNGTPFSVGKSLVGQLSASGMRVGSRWAVVNPSQQTRMQYAYVTGSGSSGSVTFLEAFSGTPIVVSQMVNLTTGRIFVINVGSVNGSRFSWIKQYQQGGSTFNSVSEDWMWIAVGV